MPETALRAAQRENAALTRAVFQLSKQISLAEENAEHQNLLVVQKRDDLELRLRHLAAEHDRVALEFVQCKSLVRSLQMQLSLNAVVSKVECQSIAMQTIVDQPESAAEMQISSAYDALLTENEQLQAESEQLRLHLQQVTAHFEQELARAHSNITMLQAQILQMEKTSQNRQELVDTRSSLMNDTERVGWQKQLNDQIKINDRLQRLLASAAALGVSASVVDRPSPRMPSTSYQSSIQLTTLRNDTLDTSTRTLLNSQIPTINEHESFPVSDSRETMQSHIRLIDMHNSALMQITKLQAEFELLKLNQKPAIEDGLTGYTAIDLIREERDAWKDNTRRLELELLELKTMTVKEDLTENSNSPTLYMTARRPSILKVNLTAYSFQDYKTPDGEIKNFICCATCVHHRYIDV